jgi:hypothetical protein
MMAFLFLLLLVIYFGPTIIAWPIRHRDRPGSIFLVNLFLGWTLVGWVICLMWALQKEDKEVQPTVSIGRPDEQVQINSASIRADEQVQMSLASTTMRKHLSRRQFILYSLADGVTKTGSAYRGEGPFGPDGRARGVVKNPMAVPKSSSFKNVVVTDKRILLPDAQGTISRAATTLVHNFMVYEPGFSEKLVEDFKTLGLPQMQKALKEAKEDNWFVAYLKLAFFRKPSERSLIKSGFDPRFPMVWDEIKAVELKTGGIINKEEYLVLALVPVLNSAFEEFIKSKGAGSSGFSKRIHGVPSKRRTVIELRTKSNNDIHKLYALLKGKLG